MLLSGVVLLQAVAERVLARYLALSPGTEVAPVAEPDSLRRRGIDLAYVAQGERRTAKVKPDVYFGTDLSKIDDRSLTFYRQNAGRCALQVIADSVTHDSGWVFTSEADELFYYYVAILQDEAEVRELLSEDDEHFFSHLQVERDDLLVLPMGRVRAWFAEHAIRYPSRPVSLGESSAWYRLVPRAEIESAVPGIEDRGPIFANLSG